MKSVKNFVKSGMVAAAVTAALTVGTGEASAVSLHYFYTFANSGTCNSAGAQYNGTYYTEPNGAAYLITGWSCRGADSRELWLWF